MLRKFFGKILCWIGYHELEFDDFENRGWCGGAHCVREKCTYKINPIEWPHLEEEE